MEVETAEIDDASINQKHENASTKIEDEMIRDKPEESRETSFRSTNWRWLALMFASFISFGSYYWYDYPNALSDALKNKITHEAEAESGSRYIQLYSAYSYPNIIIPLIGGVLIDQIGVYPWMILFSILTIIGQGIFTVAGYMGTDDLKDDKPFVVSFIGRTIYGMGGECLWIWQSTLISKWFAGKELSFALGTILSISWFGNTITNYIAPPVAAHVSLGFSLMIGLFTCVGSLIFAIFFILFDRYADRVDSRRGIQQRQLLSERFQCKDLNRFDTSYWLILSNWIFAYSGLLFYNISNDFFVVRYGFTQIEAGRLGSDAYLVWVFLAPVFGVLSDRIGLRVTFAFLSTVFLSLWQFMFIWIPASAEEDKSYWGLLPITLMGVTSSIYASVVYPMIPMVVKQEMLGSAYGICSSIMNTLWAFGPFLVGFITYPSAKENTYYYVNLFLGLFSSIGIVFTIILYFYDKWNLNGILQKSADEIENELRAQPKILFEKPWYETFEKENVEFCKKQIISYEKI